MTLETRSPRQGQGATSENSRSYLSEEQRRTWPESGFPEGRSRFRPPAVLLVGRIRSVFSLLAPCGVEQNRLRQGRRRFLDELYGSFSDPEQAYIDDMVVHELGHLFFGFGRTQAPRHRPQEFWFSFGLGLVYDRMVWDSLGSKRSPLFEAVISRWKTQFSGNMGVDQRLVNPDISKDAAWGLSRLQTYGHGKAFVYLTELRHRIGAASFDKIVREYLRRPVGSEISYDDFLSFCPQKYRATIVKVEQEFSVR